MDLGVQKLPWNELGRPEGFACSDLEAVIKPATSEAFPAAWDVEGSARTTDRHVHVGGEALPCKPKPSRRLRLQPT